MENKYSFVSFMVNGDYLPGLKVLVKSLFNTNTKYPLAVVIPDDANDELIKAIKAVNNKIEVIRMPYIEIKPSVVDDKYDYWKFSFFKLNSGRLYMFDKVVALDLDLLILKNIDDLFNWPHMSGVASAHIVRPDWNNVNGGVLVVEPNISYFEHLMKCLDDVRIINKTNPFSDQDVLHYMIPDWPNRNELHIPEEYNEYYRCARALAKTLENGWDGLKVLHYWGKTKPWDYNKTTILKYYAKCFFHGRFDLIKAMHIYRKYL